MNIFISTIIGGLIAVMVMLNGVLANYIGNYLSVLIIHIVGLISISIFMIVTKSKVKLNKKIPLYLYTSGAIGIITILFNNITFNKLGVSLPLALGLLGQSIISILIDHFGLFDMQTVKFQYKKLIGLLLIIFGITIMTLF